ncbi:MAG: hypothetical protein ACRD2L_18615 [Terriglobia bacterium]
MYSLVAEQEDRKGQAILVAADLVVLADGQTLAPKAISVVGQDDKEVKHSAKRGAWIAYQELKEKGVVHPRSTIARSGVIFDFAGSTVRVSGPRLNRETGPFL